MARRAGQPTARSRRLAMLLRKLRIAAELSNSEVAKATGMSSSTISRVEAAESGIYLDNLEKLLDLYQVSGPRRVQLLDIARHAEERGWLRMYSDDTLPEDWQAWTDFEADASAIFNYQPLIIPGLLQTPEYARAIIQGTNSNLSEAEIDRFVNSRMMRQARLSHPHPVKLHAMIEGSVFARHFGDSAAWVRQLRHLADSAARPNILVQVVSAEAGLHSALNGSFVILEYKDKTKLVHIEGKVSNLFLDEDEQIQAYEQTWAELQKRACNPEESVKLILDIAAQQHRKM